MIRVIREIRSSKHKVNYELREWHELHRNNISAIREIRSSLNVQIIKFNAQSSKMIRQIRSP